jgi:6-phosphogluconolactonase
MRMTRPVFGLALCFLATVAAAPKPQPLFAYVGTYTNQGSKGIYLYKFTPATAALEALGLAAETPNPTFLAVSPNGQYLYAVNEVGNYQGQRTGSVTAYRIEASTGRLTKLNTVSSHGAGPAHLTVDRTGKNVLVANYGGGSVAVLPVAADGSLREASSAIQHTGSSVNPRRQREPHAHSINMSPDNRFAIVSDLGLDKLLVYQFDAEKGVLRPNDPPFVTIEPGSGPRHFAFLPDGKHAYSINEMKSTITVLDWDAKRGAFTTKQTVSTLPAGYTGESTTAEIAVSPDGKYVYGSNRGHDSIAVFAVAADGTLKLAEITPAGVNQPRHFLLDPSGQFLIAEGQSSNNMVVFRVKPATGKLTKTHTAAEISAPVCMQFIPAAAK